MKTPNTDRPAADNIREYLKHMVGQTITASIIKMETAEGHGAVTGEVSRLKASGALKPEKKVGRTTIYLVTPKIGKIPLSGRKRQPFSRRKRRTANDSGSIYAIEKGIEIPKRCLYPFDEMKKGDSFKFSVDDKAKVVAVANRHAKKHGQQFIVKDIGKASARCWRVR